MSPTPPLGPRVAVSVGSMVGPAHGDNGSHLSIKVSTGVSGEKISGPSSHSLGFLGRLLQVRPTAQRTILALGPTMSAVAREQQTKGEPN